MSQSQLLFSTSPHVHAEESVPRIMQMVIWALMPATALAVVVFGWPALLVILLTTFTCVLAEHLSLTLLRRRSTQIQDYSAALTGLLLALNLPPYSPWWVCVIGGFFAMVVAKHANGGLGYNIFNPALIARVFLLISFPLQLTTWPTPNPLLGDQAYSFSQAISIIFLGQLPAPLDVIASATPLGQYRMDVGLGHTVQQALATVHFDYLKAAGGMMGGSLGETSAILLTLGGIYLLWKRVISWHIPVTMLAGTLIPAAIFWSMDAARYPDPLFQLITGGLIMGAFFMATDMVTSPVTIKGQIIFGFGCGLLTFIIRSWGGYPEGVSFAIVIMNAMVPLIDQYTRPTVYGTANKKD